MKDKSKEKLQEQQDLDDNYQVAFSGHVGEKVLADLEKFCGKNSKCVCSDPYDTYLALGMRSVILYIQDRLDGKFSQPKE